MSAHTPGPWVCHLQHGTPEDLATMRKLGMTPVEALTNEGQRFIMTDAETPKRVALVDCQTDFKRGKGHQTACAEREANAHLIAAAPELLEALQAVLSMHCMPTEPHRTYRDSIGAMDKARAALAKARGAS